MKKKNHKIENNNKNEIIAIITLSYTNHKILFQQW